MCRTSTILGSSLASTRSLVMVPSFTLDHSDRRDDRSTVRTIIVTDRVYDPASNSCAFKSGRSTAMREISSDFWALAPRFMARTTDITGLKLQHDLDTVSTAYDAYPYAVLLVPGPSDSRWNSMFPTARFMHYTYCRLCTRWRKKTGPSYLIANILKTSWPNCAEIGELLQYYMLNTVINFFKISSRCGAT